MSQITRKLSILSDIIVRDIGKYRPYTDEDLFNATEIFMEVFMSKMYDNQLEHKLNQWHMEMLAEKAGENIRQTIMLFTGKDMHKVAKKLMKNYEKEGS